MNLSLLVTLCNKRFQKGKKRACEVLLWHFLIKAVIAKNLDSVQVFTVYKFQPTRQKLNHEILSLLSLGYYSKEIFKYLPTFFSLSLCIFRLYTASETHQYFKDQSEKNVLFGHFSTCLGQIGSKKSKLFVYAWISCLI